MAHSSKLGNVHCLPASVSPVRHHSLHSSSALPSLDLRLPTLLVGDAARCVSNSILLWLSSLIVAAALICLVGIQKQKQITCKNTLLADNGVLAKKSGLASQLWKQFQLAESRTNNSKEISLALKRSLSDMQNPSPDDIEAGTHAQDEEDNQVLESSSSLSTANRTIQNQWVADDLEPTANQLESLRNTIIERKDKSDFLSYRLVHSGDFEPTINCVLSPTNKFDCLMLGEGDRYSQVRWRISTTLQAKLL